MIINNNRKNRVTIYEVAKQSGVSLATVSRVINNAENVSEATRDKVNTVIKKLGYKPSVLAQGLATSRSATIGVIIPSANYVYISNLLNGILEVAKIRGLSILLFTTSHSHIDSYKCIEDVIKSHVDGVIVFDDELNSDDVRFINSYGVPSVVINHTVYGDKTACITFNHEERIETIVQENLDKKGKEMVFVHVHNGGRLLSRVEKQFIQTHLSNGGVYNIFNCDDSYRQTYNDFIEYFKTNKEGYFVAYRDSIAAAIINAATDSNLRVPEDIEVLSIIGTKYSNIISPNISSLDLDFASVGKRAMNMLFDLSQNNLYEKQCKFNVVFNKKESTL